MPTTNTMIDIENTSINLKEIKTISDLKSYGEYKFVKKIINKTTGLDINSNDWESLFTQLNLISSSIEANKEKLQKLTDNDNSLKELGKFTKAKENISELISYKIKARSWVSLRDKVITLINVFIPIKTYVDKYEFFEKNKRVNFVNSSKLEDINIESTASSKNMADIISKYKVAE